MKNRGCVTSDINTQSGKYISIRLKNKVKNRYVKELVYTDIEDLIPGYFGKICCQIL